MAGTTAVPGSPGPIGPVGPDGVPQDAVPGPFDLPGPPRNAYEDHTPGPAALYEPRSPYETAPGVPPVPPAPSTGWTVTGMPAVNFPPAPAPVPPTAAPTAPVPATATPLPFAVPAGAPFGSGTRGRILVIEGGYGNSGRRTWGRGGPSQAPVLSAMLAAVSPQVLLAAESVDAVHLPGASDPHTVLAHLRAAARHPGPLLIHLGGHLLADKRSGQLHLTLRDSKAGTVRQDGLAWQAVAAELRLRPADWQTLVIADLSADPNAFPLLQGTVSPLTDGLPLWAVISPDPEQIGTFTRALIEALHGGRPGADAVLAPEQLRQQVYSVLRPDVVILATHAPDRPIFRNTARRSDAPLLDNVPFEGPRPAAVLPRPAAARPQQPVAASAVRLDKPSAGAAPVRLDKPAVLVGGPSTPVSLRKAGVPPTPPPPARPVDLVKAYAWQPPAEEPAQVPVEEPVEAPVAVAEAEQVEQVEQTEQAEQVERADPLTDYREVIGRIVRSADAGDHAAATDLAFALELEAIAAHGADSEPVLQVRQVRAHVCRLADKLAEAAEIYREVATTLLRAKGTEDPEAHRAATNAEACWRAIPDPAAALALAPEIIELRAYLPGPDNRKLRAAERYLSHLAAEARA